MIRWSSEAQVGTTGLFLLSPAFERTATEKSLSYPLLRAESCEAACSNHAASGVA